MTCLMNQLCTVFNLQIGGNQIYMNRSEHYPSFFNSGYKITNFKRVIKTIEVITYYVFIMLYY